MLSPSVHSPFYCLLLPKSKLLNLNIRKRETLRGLLFSLPTLFGAKDSFSFLYWCFFLHKVRPKKVLGGKKKHKKCDFLLRLRLTAKPLMFYSAKCPFWCHGKPSVLNAIDSDKRLGENKNGEVAHWLCGTSPCGLVSVGVKSHCPTFTHIPSLAYIVSGKISLHCLHINASSSQLEE